MSEDRIPNEQPWADDSARLIDERFSFDAPLTRVDLRRRELVIALSRQPGGRASIDELPEIAPRLVDTYTQKSRQALNGDLTSLLQMGLVWIEPTSVRTRAFEIFEPRPPGSALVRAGDSPPRGARRGCAAQILGAAARLSRGAAISKEEAYRIVEAVMSKVDDEIRSGRGVTTRQRDLTDLADLIWNGRE